ncbi:MAG: hypothetical protein LBQ58_08035 [Synergistaceae bacterium]|nr:hypothetical protein [Synergistaceae bacterium]
MRFLKRAFTLAEVSIALSLLMALTAFLTITGASAVNKYGDPHSEYRIALEVQTAAGWIENMLKRALIFRQDVKLIVPSNVPSSNLRFLWTLSNHSVKFSSENIEFRSVSAISTHAYSNSFQTLTPALTLCVFKKGVDGIRKITDWRISVSAYGLVRAYQAA